MSTPIPDPESVDPESAELESAELESAELESAELNDLVAADASPLPPPPPPPPASFEMMVSMFFTQGMAMLGQIPNPATGKPEINKPFAKHTIDTLDVLGEKTKGNLTPEESKMLAEALHALRMMYVNARQTTS